ncbi:hypothetical protein FACS1894167_12580 [Synergistales bacterium]|nr:hypothetical protein FACS1894167_12580 [Synergistales bacterium]GHV51007.1 hypothetical protein FACS1894216_04210 [Synergistales bacterium]
MTLDDIAKSLNGKILCCEEKLSSITVEKAFASDLMSDVLAFCKPGALLITGLTNVQIVRTVQMLDIPAVLFVRGKVPLDETVNLARDSGIPLVLLGTAMFGTCGELYAKGVLSSFDGGNPNE